MILLLYAVWGRCQKRIKKILGAWPCLVSGPFALKVGPFALINKKYTHVNTIFKIFKPSNIINTSFIFNNFHIYNYQGEWTQGERELVMLDLLVVK